MRLKDGLLPVVHYFFNMKTITFYSYKGGVGRSLALSNIAIRLSQLNKKVCVVDFDLDAPGLQFKFKDYILESHITNGVVDYIYEFSHNGNVPKTVKNYTVKLKPKNKSFESIDFISAGNIDELDYWKKLSMIRWADMFYGENPQGIRLPFTDSTKDKQKEFIIIERRKKEFEDFLNVKNFEISLIHSDRRLEEEERPLIGYDYEEKGVSISNDYLKLFDLLTTGLLTKTDIEKFNKLRDAEIEFSKATVEQDLAKKLIHLSKAIKLNDQQVSYFNARASTYESLKDFKKAISDYLRVSELNPQNDLNLYNLGYAFYELKKYKKSIFYLNKIDKSSKYYLLALVKKADILQDTGKINGALEILNSVLVQNPNNANALNNRAEVYRFLGRYSDAYIDIYRAIELSPDQAIFFGTLAEICADDGKNEEFYLNLAIGLSNGIEALNMRSAKDVYYKFAEEIRFKNLMTKYDINANEIFES
jgi:tetratricopeptide (TPR) repeat protein